MTGTFTGPDGEQWEMHQFDSDGIGARPATVTVPRAVLEELAKEATLVAAAFDDVVAPKSSYEGRQAKIATLIGDLGVEGL